MHVHGVSESSGSLSSPASSIEGDAFRCYHVQWRGIDPANHKLQRTRRLRWRTRRTAERARVVRAKDRRGERDAEAMSNGHDPIRVTAWRV